MDEARNKERMLMLDDANQWLMSGKYVERPHSKTGAMALHIAAAKGYADVIKLVLFSDILIFIIVKVELLLIVAVILLAKV